MPDAYDSQMNAVDTQGSMALKKLTIKQKLMQDLKATLPQSERNSVGRLKKRHKSVAHASDGQFGVSFEEFMTIKKNDSKMDNYQANLSRLQKIQAQAITNNQYDIKNYIQEEGAMYKKMRQDRIYNARNNGILSSAVIEEDLEGQSQSNLNSSMQTFQ